MGTKLNVHGWNQFDALMTIEVSIYGSYNNALQHKRTNNDGDIMRSTGVWSLSMERYPGKLYGGFLKWGYPKMDGLFHGKSQYKTDDLGVPPLQETSI